MFNVYLDREVYLGQIFVDVPVHCLHTSLTVCASSCNLIPHILKDSQQLLQRANEVQTKFSYIFSGDFDSLYLKIKGNHCINLITQFLLSKPQILSNFKLFKIDLNAVNIFLSLIFSCNIFKFKENFYLQLIGLPMGCICGPSVANLFLYILESKWIYFTIVSSTTFY